MTEAEPRRSVFQMLAAAPCPVFPDFIEEVRSSWDHSASAPTALKQVAPLVSLEGTEKLGLSRMGAVANTAIVTEHLERLGLIFNDEKNRLTPVQCTTYLGLHLGPTEPA
ncbi:UNVERIFIED_CONTAM: hypothetical protein FKN15_017704 [Acipenser sinensis]